MDIEAYKVAVKLSLSENITAGLLGVSKQFAKTEESAAKLKNELNSIGKMAAVGGGLLAVGLSISKGLDAAMKSAREVAKAQADFKTLNLNAMEMAQVNAMAADQTHKTLGSTIAGNIRLIQDLHTAFGDLHHALELAPEFTKYETTVKMALGEHAADGMVNAAARALEHRGGKVTNNPEEFNKELNMMSQVQFATKNRVSPRDYLLASQTGKGAYSLLSPEYLYGQFGGLMSILGGERSGTELMTAFSSLIGGHMDKKAKGFLADIGMYDEGVSKERMKIMRKVMSGMSPEEKRIYLQSVGGESLLSGGLKSQYAAMFANPAQLAAVMAEKIRARFGKNLSDEEVAQYMYKNFNRSTGDLLGQNVVNKTKFDKDAAVFRKAMSFYTAYDSYLNNPDGAGIALTAAWTNLKATLGLQLLPVVTKLTLGFARFLDKITELADKNPELAKYGTYALAAAAGLTTLAGGITLIGAAFSAVKLASSLGVISSFATVLGGPVVWGITAAATAGYLIYKNWDEIKKSAKEMWGEFKTIASSIWDRVKLVGENIKNWKIWSYVENAFNDFSTKLSRGFTSLYDFIIKQLNKIPGVNILNSNEIGLKSNAFQLLDDINRATGADRKSIKVPERGTYGGDYANAMLGNNGGAGQSYADGMRQASSGMSNPGVVTGGNGMVQVTSKTYLDGKQIAETVSSYQGRMASRPPTGVSGVDATMTLLHPGMGSFTTR